MDDVNPNIIKFYTSFAQCGRIVFWMLWFIWMACSKYMENVENISLPSMFWEFVLFLMGSPMNYLDGSGMIKYWKKRHQLHADTVLKGGSSYRWLVDHDRNVWMVEKCTPHGFCFKKGWVYLNINEGVKFPAFQQCRNIIVPNSQLFDNVEILYFPHKDRGMTTRVGSKFHEVHHVA